MNNTNNSTTVAHHSGNHSQSHSANQGSFQRTQVVNNFKFEMVNMTKAGGLLVLDYKITNLAADDRELIISQPSVYFYDDLGNLIYSEQVCIATSCNYGRGYNPSSLEDKFRVGSYNYFAKNLMPSGIPLNAKITIDEINKRAQKFRSIYFF